MTVESRSQSVLIVLIYPSSTTVQYFCKYVRKRAPFLAPLPPSPQALVPWELARWNNGHHGGAVDGITDLFGRLCHMCRKFDLTGGC